MRQAQRWVAFDKAKTEAMFLSKRRKKPTESVRGRRLRSPVQPACHAVAQNLDRLQNDPLRAPLREVEEVPQGDSLHPGQLGMCPDACRRGLVQASALYGAELWWDDRKGLGGEAPVRRAPKAGEPAREGDNGHRTWAEVDVPRV